MWHKGRKINFFVLPFSWFFFTHYCTVREFFGGFHYFFSNFPCFYPFFNITFPIKLDSEVVPSCWTHTTLTTRIELGLYEGYPCLLMISCKSYGSPKGTFTSIFSTSVGDCAPIFEFARWRKWEIILQFE